MSATGRKNHSPCRTNAAFLRRLRAFPETSDEPRRSELPEAVAIPLPVGLFPPMRIGGFQQRTSVVRRGPKGTCSCCRYHEPAEASDGRQAARRALRLLIIEAHSLFEQRMFDFKVMKQRNA